MEKLRDAELKLEGFRTRTITLPSEATIISPGLEETRDPVFQHLLRQEAWRRAI